MYLYRIFLFLQLYENTVSTNFLEFLASLGWPVSISSHAGWTGHVQTSWRKISTTPTSTSQPETDAEHGGALYNGNTHVLYWADVSSEVAFVVPTSSIKAVYEPSSDSYSESTNGKFSLKIGKNMMH